MKLSELIHEIEKVIAEHGDLEVSNGYSDYPEGYFGIKEIQIIDETKITLAGKKFAVIEGSGTIVYR